MTSTPVDPARPPVIAGAGSPERSIRRVLLLDLKDDPEAISAYRLWHRPGGPPAAVTRALREAGVLSMEIWNLGPRLAMIMDVTAEFDPQAAADTAAADLEVQAWETLMDAFQQRLPFAPATTKWAAAERIYALEEQP